MPVRVREGVRVTYVFFCLCVRANDTAHIDGGRERLKRWECVCVYVTQLMSWNVGVRLKIIVYKREITKEKESVCVCLLSVCMYVCVRVILRTCVFFP